MVACPILHMAGELRGTPSSLRKKPICTRSMSIKAALLAKGARTLQLYDITGRMRALKSLSSNGMSKMISSVHLASRAGVREQI